MSVIAAAAALAGCQSGPAAPTEPPVNSGLNALLGEADREESPEEMVSTAPTLTELDKQEGVRQAIKDLQNATHSGVEELDAPPLRLRPDEAQATRQPTELARNPKALNSSLRAMTSAVLGLGTATPGQRRAAEEIARNASSFDTQVLMPAITTETEETIEDQVAELAEELASLLRDQAAGSADPARAYLAMATLEAIRPGIIVELSADGAGELATVLSPAEIEAVRAARAMVAGLVDEDAELANPNELADHLEAVASQLRPHTTIAIEDTQLCRRVVGFGQYSAFGSNDFVAGRPVRAIVYVELDRFAHRKVTGRDETLDGDRWAVEVTQELSLFVGRERRPVWHRPEQRVLSTSRRKIRDLFLTDQLTLPATLGVGEYTLRVRVRDLTTDAVDERLVPIRILADASARRIAG